MYIESCGGPAYVPAAQFPELLSALRLVGRLYSIELPPKGGIEDGAAPVDPLTPSPPGIPAELACDEALANRVEEVLQAFGWSGTFAFHSPQQIGLTYLEYISDDPYNWPTSGDALLAAVAQWATSGRIERTTGGQTYDCLWRFNGAGGLEQFWPIRLYGDWAETVRGLLHALTTPTTPTEVHQVCTRAQTLLATKEQNEQPD